ncbi:MAG: SCO family protein [Xanthomonadaceae bacterium]|nr:SCO family protein [Xanthomonadaceae bacterium]
MRHEPANTSGADSAAGTADSPSIRRKLLGSLPGMIAGSLPALALAAESEEELNEKTQLIIDRANANGLPDTLVTTHTGEQVLFHKDLIQDRVVLINFMSIGDEEEFPACACLAKLVRELGDAFGKEVFAISVSYDPANDTPERLAEFAKRFDAPEGWHFVTASAEDVLTVGYKLYRAEGRPKRQMDGDRLHFGNAKAGLWGTMSAFIQDVDLAVSRVRTVMPRPRHTGTPRRAGPRPAGSTGPIYDHRNRSGTA